MVQGLGPGFTTVATRRSVILRVEGLEFVFTFFTSAPAAESLPTSAPPNIAAEVFKISRRPSVVSLWLDIVFLLC